MNYYEIKYLKEHLKIKLAGSQLMHCNTRYKNLIEFFFENQSNDFRLVYSTAPGNIALFLDRAANPKKSNTVTFFESLYGQSVTDVQIAPTDRVLTIHFEGDIILWFKLFSNRANVMMVSEGAVVESFKGANEEDVQLPEVKEIDLIEGPAKGTNAKQKILNWNPMIPRANVDDLVRLNKLEEKNEEELRSFVKELTGQLEDHPALRLLENGNTSILEPRFLPLPTEREFTDINDLISYRYKTYSHDQRLKQQKSQYLKRFKRQIKRTKSGLDNLNQADKGLERSEQYEKYGHLLMANGHLQPEDDQEITVDDLYDEGEKLTIPLEPKLSVVENAERYYKKSRNAEESYEEALERIPVLQEKMDTIQELQAQLKDINRLRDLQDWEKEHQKELEDLNILAQEDNSEKESAFHNLKVDGYTVWIGKNARNNDLLVQMAHKEDVWLHARGVPGSHVLIRMGNNKDMPSRNIILKAASYAAFNSKAKGAEVVPVIYTKKKFVRKPKGSSPGAVVVDREEVELVSPEKPML